MRARSTSVRVAEHTEGRSIGVSGGGRSRGGAGVLGGLWSHLVSLSRGRARATGGGGELPSPPWPRAHVPSLGVLSETARALEREACAGAGASIVHRIGQPRLGVGASAVLPARATAFARALAARLSASAWGGRAPALCAGGRASSPARCPAVAPARRKRRLSCAEAWFADRVARPQRASRPLSSE